MLHLLTLLSLALAAPSPAGEDAIKIDKPVFASETEASFFTGWASTERTVTTPSSIRLERITTAVPWPRGMVYHDGGLVVLARGRHRNAGGIDPTINDRCGSLFRVDTGLAEDVVPGEQAGAAVRDNAQVLAEAKSGPFSIYDPAKGPPIEDTRMDRPYCTLAFDESSQNFFICGYSGVDLPLKQFRKNATDSIHRFDLRDSAWHSVELHDASVVPADELGWVVPSKYYPHHDPASAPAPHGWLNGPDGAAVAGQFLYAVGKDNHVLVQYDLGDVRGSSAAGAPESRLIFQEHIRVRRFDASGAVRIVPAPALGASALATDRGYLYVGFRSSSSVVRFALDEDGDVRQPLIGELVAAFEPWDPQAGRSANLIDLTFNSRGELFVATAQSGRIWNAGVPDPQRVFNGIDYGPHEAPGGVPNEPYIDLPAATGNPRAQVGNIVFDEEDRLYLCSGNYDTGTRMAGVIYRVTAP